jgi:DnaJ domain
MSYKEIDCAAEIYDLCKDKKPCGKDPYTILELKQSKPTESAINKAYRELSLQYHPDKSPSDTQKFVDITHAKTILLKCQEEFSQYNEVIPQSYSNNKPGWRDDTLSRWWKTSTESSLNQKFYAEHKPKPYHAVCYTHDSAKLQCNWLQWGEESINFDSDYKFSEHRGKVIAKASLAQSIYIRVLNNACVNAAEIYGSPEQLPPQYIDNQGSVTLKLTACKKIGHNGNYFEVSAGDNVATSIARLKERYSWNKIYLSGYKNHHFAIYNGAGAVVSDIYGSPEQLDVKYLDLSVHGELHIAYDTYM